MTTINNANKKKWAILIYACGNNDLEPEMYKILADISGGRERDNVHIALELGREHHELVQILRQSQRPLKVAEDWQGVRRYTFSGGKLVMLQDLGKVNMAHPETLKDFLIWGFCNFSAEKYMLILGGHGYQFVGAITDYSQGEPYIMGIPGMAEAINQAGQITGKHLDLALFDTCYFNFVEILYELGASSAHGTKNIITYIGGGPIQGLSCGKILEQSDRLSHFDDTKSFIVSLTRELANNLVAFEINHNRLEKIKGLFNDIACAYCDRHFGNVNFQDILNQGNMQSPWCSMLTELVVELNSLLICTGTQGSTKSLINVANQATTDLEKIKIYSMLSFAKRNNWTYILSDRTVEINSLEQNNNVFSPLRLSPREVYGYISLMNPGFSHKQIREAFIALAKYKRWTFE